MSINIVIVGCENCSDAAQQTGDMLHAMFSSQHYVVYQLSQLDFRRTLWEKGTCLLVLLAADAEDMDLSRVVSFVRNGGKALLLWELQPGLEISLVSLVESVWFNEYKRETILRDSVLVSFIESKGALCICKADSLTQSDIKELMHIFQLKTCDQPNESTSSLSNSSDYHVFYREPISEEHLHELINTLKRTLNSTIPSLTIHLHNCNHVDAQEDTEASNGKAIFSYHQYYSHLNSKRMGQVVIYSNTMQSSFTLLEKLIPSTLVKNLNLLISSRVQLQARGSTEHRQWISPEGQASFTFTLNAHPQSVLARHGSFVQHLVTLSLLLTVKKLISDEDVNVCIKWPNDLCYRDATDGEAVLKKLAGVLVQNHVNTEANIFQFIIGVGFNLFNRLPTISLREILSLHCIKLDHLTTETFIAKILNDLENMVDCLTSCDSNESDLTKLREIYEQHWIYREQEAVVMISNNTTIQNVHGRVSGVDLDGRLLFTALNEEDSVLSRVLSIHPDIDDLLFQIK